jgi:glutamine cyclotransferase
VKVKNKNNKFKQVRFTFILLEEYNSEGDKWVTTQTDRMLDDSKGRDFFQLFDRMRL